MSGGHPDGINESDLGNALRNYGMPLNPMKLNKVFQCMDLKQNGLITFPEFRETVLEKQSPFGSPRCFPTDMEDNATMQHVYEGKERQEEEQEGKEGKEGKEECESTVVPGLGDKFTDMISQMNASRARDALPKQPTPGSIHASVQEKVQMFGLLGCYCVGLVPGIDPRFFICSCCVRVVFLLCSCVFFSFSFFLFAPHRCEPFLEKIGVGCKNHFEMPTAHHAPVNWTLKHLRTSCPNTACRSPEQN
tara:strand:+ start:143 stop:886 length:744 start_codon:yes stop_codon:yes gene_type:complete